MRIGHLKLRTASFDKSALSSSSQLRKKMNSINAGNLRDLVWARLSHIEPDKVGITDN
jgi:hypothetical protein